jgi:molybdate transport system regulatory protein
MPRKSRQRTSQPMPLGYHRIKCGRVWMGKVRLRIDLAPGTAIGPGKIELLEAIDATGSLSEAARRLGMSYRRAWLLLDSLNKSFASPLATASVGGKGGGGVQVTPLGAELVKRFRRLEASVDRLANEQFAEFRVAAPAATKPVRTVAPRKAAGTRSRRAKPAAN